MAHNGIQYSEKYYDDIYEYRCVNTFGKHQLQREAAKKHINCRHVVLPPEIAAHLPKNRLLDEVKLPCQRAIQFLVEYTFNPGTCFQNEWRALGVQQSRGWVHYAIHRPEPHIMLFR
jgi:cyclin-dependent kinase regulatory subunit CKS1